jgi:hypothetical protein
VRANKHACFTLTSLVERLTIRLRGHFTPLKLLQSAVPILAEFVAPLLISPD